MARRKRRHTRRRTTHARTHHRRRSYRRNPPRGFSTRSITHSIMDGVKGGVGVTLGKAAVRVIPSLAGLPRTGAMGIALQGLTAVLVAPLAQKFVGRDFARAVLWGGFAGPVESAILAAKIPVIAPALSSYPEELAAIPANIRVSPSSVSSYPQLAAYDEEEMYAVQ